MATFVFTDLVDSTATAQRLGPGRAEALRGVHFGLLRGAILASGGIEVKNLGDGLMVMFTSPSRALAGSVGMQQAIERHNQRAAEPLRVRVGISAGEAVEDDGDYFGDPVVEAARLCAAAEGGQILASDAVRAMVGRNAGQELRSVGELRLKGISEPMSTVEVVWEPEEIEESGAVPIPGRLTRVASDALFGFFGRDDALQMLQNVAKRSQAESTLEVVLISGEAGIGKSTLVAHTARAAHVQGGIVLYGRCDEDFGVPYQTSIGRPG